MVSQMLGVGKHTHAHTSGVRSVLTLVVCKSKGKQQLAISQTLSIFVIKKKNLSYSKHCIDYVTMYINLSPWYPLFFFLLVKEIDTPFSAHAFYGSNVSLWLATLGVIMWPTVANAMWQDCNCTEPKQKQYEAWWVSIRAFFHLSTRRTGKSSKTFI